MRYLSIFFTLALIPQVCHAEILWDYLSTDGSTTVAGQLTTQGNLGDLTADGNFLAISLLSCSVNGTPITSWYNGSVLPFACTEPDGAGVLWSAVDGYGVPSYYAWPEAIDFGGTGGDFVYLSAANFMYTMVAYSGPSEFYADFEPTVTYMTPADAPPVVPEPSTLALLAVGLFGIGGYASRKRRQRV